LPALQDVHQADRGVRRVRLLRRRFFLGDLFLGLPEHRLQQSGQQFRPAVERQFEAPYRRRQRLFIGPAELAGRARVQFLAEVVER
jgi:hypothetical protein